MAGRRETIPEWEEIKGVGRLDAGCSRKKKLKSRKPTSGGQENKGVDILSWENRGDREKGVL